MDCFHASGTRCVPVKDGIEVLDEVEQPLPDGILRLLTDRRTYPYEGIVFIFSEKLVQDHNHFL